MTKTKKKKSWLEKLVNKLKGYIMKDSKEILTGKDWEKRKKEIDKEIEEIEGDFDILIDEEQEN